MVLKGRYLVKFMKYDLIVYMKRRRWIFEAFRRVLHQRIGTVGSDEEQSVQYSLLSLNCHIACGFFHYIENGYVDCSYLEAIFWYSIFTGFDFRIDTSLP